MLFRKWTKKSCVLRRNLISIYKRNRTLHGRLRIRILSSGAESISHEWAKRTSESYFQHSKIKFVSSRGHFLSCISYTSKSRLHNVIALLCLCAFYFTYFYNQNYSKLEGKQMQKKRQGEEICKLLDFLVFSAKDDKS